jgi:alkylation response protein AidB-like acyl-CoA dehydrogenase
MDLGLTEIQQMLKTSAQEFLARECPTTLVREMEEDDKGYPDDLWRQIAGLGWTGVPFPEQYGGTGGDFLDLAVLLEEMGRALAPSPYFSTVVLGGLTVLDAGTDAQRADLLSRICDGSGLMTLALTEASATYEAWGVETTATKTDGGYRLDGVKLFVPDAHVAHVMIVAARTSLLGGRPAGPAELGGRPAGPAGDGPAQGITLFLVPADAEGLEVSRMSTIGSERQFEVRLAGVTVPDSAVLGQVNGGWPVAERAIQRAVAGRCVEMLGGAYAVVDMTVDYVKQRTQFGRPVGTFQAVQHHCAEMATDVEGSRGVAYQAAWRLAQGMPAQREVSIAKAWISAAYRRVCSTAHQCHGAIGFTKEHDLQLYTRRAKVHELSYGDAHYHKELALANIDSE